MADSGDGILPADLAHVFSPWYRASMREVGVGGLGLMIVREVARTHGGDVEVESQEAVGTTFTIRLPLLREAVLTCSSQRREGRAPVEGFLVKTGESTLEADNVVVAMANYREPWRPPFAKDLKPEILQLNARDYRNPSSLRRGSVLVVGVGNSGADIAMDVAKSHPTLLAGKETGHIPVRIESFFGRHILFRLIRFLGHHVLSLKTPIGRKARPQMLGRPADPRQAAGPG